MPAQNSLRGHLFQSEKINHCIMRKLLPLIGLLLLTLSAAAQKHNVSGIVKDSANNETIVGANVVLKGTTNGAVTGIDGDFTFDFTNGKYTLQVSFVGYTTMLQEIEVSGKPIRLTFLMKSEIVLEEVEVVADIARARQTPVAFSTITPTKIEERLAGQDIPMLLNKTPGVYATQQGGGDGDARITLRGFNQRFVGVLLDGAPVNDMENGWVYWSNWFGLHAVTGSIQIQRGLSASRLALPSVGGTINILTKGIQNKKQITIEQDIDQNGKLTTNLGYASGRLKNGWGITMAGSYKTGNSWLEQTDVDAWFYFFKVDKEWGKHITSFSTFGAPQKHKQRSYKRSIADYDTTLAKDVGVLSSEFPTLVNQGIAYNQHWGLLKRDADVWNSDHSARIIDENAKTVVLNEMENIYYKPQFNLRDVWAANDKLNLNSLFYVSIGTGGAVKPRSSLKNTNLISPSDYEANPGLYTEDQIGQINWQSIYNQNSKPTQSGFGLVYPINPLYSNDQYYSTNYLVFQKNNHKWFGFLSNLDYKLNPSWTISGGVDLRAYRASHYMEVYDLLGGDYAVDKYDITLDYEADSSLAMKRVGDKVYYNNDGLVRWAGVYGLAEYKAAKWTAFLNMTASNTYIKKIDFFKDLESDWYQSPGFTIKTGANYNIDAHNNVFCNIGYISKAREFTSYYLGVSAVFKADSIISNEKIKAFELGYSFTSKKFTLNLNTYYTAWENKAANQVRGKYTNPETGVELDTYGDIPGMNALHMGVELDFTYKVLHNLEIQGLVSVGDWTWNKKIDNLQMYYLDTNEPAYTFGFDATGIHVGDAAQTQLGTSIRYEPIKRLYVEGGLTYFNRYYADFTPEYCTDENGNPVDSWRIPAYSLVEFHAGYRFRVKSLQHLGFTIKLNMLNALNSLYISDATNNDTYIQRPFNTFDARSASVFIGAPRQASVSLKIAID